MNDGSSLSDLIARLEKAAGPDRELDRAIALAMGWTESRASMHMLRSPSGTQEFPYAYTRSIDAAMTLVPDDQWLALSGPHSKIGGFYHGTGPKRFDVLIGKSDDGGGEAKGATHAIALCIAAMKAVSVAERTVRDENGIVHGFSEP